jgi:hypothetical protein
MEVSGQLHAPAALLQDKQPPGTHWIEGWVGPRAGLDGMIKRKNPCTWQQSNPGGPTRSLVATLTGTYSISNFHSVKAEPLISDSPILILI